MFLTALEKNQIHIQEEIGRSLSWVESVFRYRALASVFERYWEICKLKSALESASKAETQDALTTKPRTNGIYHVPRPPAVLWVCLLKTARGCSFHLLSNGWRGFPWFLQWSIGVCHFSSRVQMEKKKANRRYSFLSFQVRVSGRNGWLSSVTSRSWVENWSLQKQDGTGAPAAPDQLSKISLAALCHSTLKCHRMTCSKILDGLF